MFLVGNTPTICEALRIVKWGVWICEALRIVVCSLSWTYEKRGARAALPGWNAWTQRRAKKAPRMRRVFVGTKRKAVRRWCATPFRAPSVQIGSCTSGRWLLTECECGDDGICTRATLPFGHPRGARANATCNRLRCAFLTKRRPETYARALPIHYHAQTAGVARAVCTVPCGYYCFMLTAPKSPFSPPDSAFK